MFVAAAVVSARQTKYADADAGLKAISTDGLRQASSLSLRRAQPWFLGDEHGAIIPPSPRIFPQLGDVVWRQPGHCDPTINLYDAFLVWAKGRWARWLIDARLTTPCLETLEP